MDDSHCSERHDLFLHVCNLMDCLHHHSLLPHRLDGRKQRTRTQKNNENKEFWWEVWRRRTSNCSYAEVVKRRKPTRIKLLNKTGSWEASWRYSLVEQVRLYYPNNHNCLAVLNRDGFLGILCSSLLHIRCPLVVECWPRWSPHGAFHRCANQFLLRKESRQTWIVVDVIICDFSVRNGKLVLH